MTTNATRRCWTALSLAPLSLLAACGGGGGSNPPDPPPPPPTYSIGGSVSGLGGTLVLQQGGANNLNVTANGAFTFPGTVAQGAAYAVTILTQPSGQTCTATAASGTASANVTSVTINCVSFYTVGGTVSGLTAGTVVLQNNLGNNLSISANGAFTFPGTVAQGAAYAVTVLTQPSGQTCTATAASGNANANVTSVAINCVGFFTVSGTVSGLTAGTVVLQNNLGNNLSISANGAFTFPAPVAGGTNYSVSVSSQPPGPDCAVSSGSGIANANVTNVAVVCTPDPATVFLPLTASQNLQPTELHVVTSKALARAPIRVATNWQTSLGYAIKFSRDGAGKLVLNKPATLLYTGGTSVSDSHVYALDLSAGSSLVPRQVSSLASVNLNVFNCEMWQAYGDLDDPASAFLLAGRPANSADPNFVCDGGTLDFVRVSQSDSATTAPAPVASLPAGTKYFLYRPNGTLAGMVVCDGATHTLMMYHGESLTAPTPLLSGCFNFVQLWPRPVALLNTLAEDPTYAFIFVWMQDGSRKLHRVDYTGAISPMLYDQQRESIDGTVIDDQYLYFSDRGLTSPPLVQSFFRVRLDGTAPAQSLYSYPIQGGDTPLTLMGETASKLVFMRGLTIDPVTSARSADVRTVDKTGPVNASILATYNDAPVWVQVFDDLLFINVTRVLAGTPSTYASDSEVRTVAGNVVQPLRADSSFTGTAAGRMLHFRESVVGGARTTRVESLAVSPAQTLATTVLTRSDGSDYTLADSFPYSFTYSVTPSIGLGFASGNSSSAAIAFDISKGSIETITLPNKQVAFVREN